MSFRRDRNRPRFAVAALVWVLVAVFCVATSFPAGLCARVVAGGGDCCMKAAAACAAHGSDSGSESESQSEHAPGLVPQPAPCPLLFGDGIAVQAAGGSNAASDGRTMVVAAALPAFHPRGFADGSLHPAANAASAGGARTSAGVRRVLRV